MPTGIYGPRRKLSAAEREAISVRMTGSVPSQETRAKMRAAKLANPSQFWLGKRRGPQTEEVRAKIGNANRGKAKPEGFGAHLRILLSGVQRSAETRAKMLVAVRTPEAREKMRLSVLGKPCRHSKRQFWRGSIRMKSSYEVRLATILDALGIRWQYEPRRFDLGEQTWAPDFYLPDVNCWWETKGWLGPNSARTIALFRERYPDEILTLVREQDLLALEAAVQKAA